MKLILFRGRPGTGKTTLSESLSKETSFPVLRKDDIYDVIADFVEDHNIRNKISYNVLYKILESNIKNGSTFILDYPFQNREDLEIIKNWCKFNGVEFKSILITCSDENIWSKRFEERAKNPKPNQLLTDFESFKKLYGNMYLIPEEGELCIDTVNSIDIILPKIIKYI